MLQGVRILPDFTKYVEFVNALNGNKKCLESDLHDIKLFLIILSFISIYFKFHKQNNICSAFTRF